jgi:hypothetical protein
MTDSLVTHFMAVAIDHQNGIFRAETDVVERLWRSTSTGAGCLHPGAPDCLRLKSLHPLPRDPHPVIRRHVFCPKAEAEDLQVGGSST